MTWLTFAATTPIAHLSLVALVEQYRTYAGVVTALSHGERTLAVPLMVFN